MGITVLTGTITINAPLYLAANQSWWIAEGRTLIVNGALSGTGNIDKPKMSDYGINSPIRLMGDNSAYGGRITINNGAIEIGHDNALGTNMIISAKAWNAQSPTLVSFDGNRSVSTSWANGFTVKSAYDLTVGDTSAAQDANKSLSWDNAGTGKLIISGIMRISVKESTFSGTGPIQIAGPASNTGMNQNNDDGMKITATLVELNKTPGKDVCGGNFTVFTNSTARWLANDQLIDSKRLRMRGGTVDLNNHSEVTGELYLFGSSVLSMGSGASSLSLATSAGVTWTPATILTVKAFTEGVDALRVGTTASGLTVAQLDQIRFEGYRNASARMDTQGYVYPPKPLGTTVIIR